MRTRESEKLKLLYGRTLRTPNAPPAAGKPAWYRIPERTDSLVSAVYTGGGNSIGFLTGQYRTVNGLAVIDFASLLEEQSKGDRR